MNTTVLRAVLDTNFFITIIGKQSQYRWVFDAIIEGRLILCVSKPILYEYEEILERKTSVEVAKNIIKFLSVHPYVEQYEIYYDWNLIDIDPDDNKFVDCAFTSGSVIVSSDGHFNKLLETDFPKITLLSVGEFSDKYKTLIDFTK